MKHTYKWLLCLILAAVLLFGLTPYTALDAAAAEPALSQGQKNIVKRAQQMTQIQWTPVSDITGWDSTLTYKTGVTYQGLPYGQPVNGDYVPWEISLEGFIDAVNDPDSLMYTSYSSYNKRAPYYSIDCSAFVSWAWDLDTRQNTTGLTSYADEISSSSYADAQVGDCLIRLGRHAALITDIDYDASGEICAIEVSEANTAYASNHCCRVIGYGTGKTYTLAYFVNKYFANDYILYRCKTRDSVTYTHSCAIPLEGDDCADCSRDDACGCYTGFAGTYRCTTASSGLNIRSGHGSSYASVGTIPSGAEVRVTSASGVSSSDWAHVEYNGISGYASMGYLRADLGEDFYANILHTAHGKLLTNDAPNVSLRSSTGGSSQVWHFQRQSDYSYRITSVYDGTSLAVAGSGTGDGANVQTETDSGSGSQRWSVYGAAGRYILSAKCASTVLDLTDNASADGTNLRMWSYNGFGAQLFSVEPLEDYDTTVPPLPTITLTGSAQGMMSGNYALGEPITLRWSAENSDGCWVNVTSDADGSYVINRQLTDASCTFTPDAPGSYTIAMRAYNEAGNSDRLTLTFQVRDVAADVWLSDTALGTEGSAFPAGGTVYCNYTLFDTATGDPLSTFCDSAAGEVAVTAADGTKIASGTVSGEQGSLSFRCTGSGTFQASVTAFGNTTERTFTVYGTPLAPEILLSESEQGMYEGSFGLGEAVTLTWHSDNSHAYWLRITHAETGTNIINEQVTYTSYTFTPASAGSYTAIMRAYNGAGVSDTASTISFQVRDVAADVWLSDSALGEALTSLPAGKELYCNFSLFDKATGELLSSFCAPDAPVVLSVLDGDGVVLASQTFTGQDQGSLSFQCDAPGACCARVTVEGTVYESSFTVYGPPEVPAITLSDSVRGMNADNYELGEAISLRWQADNASIYWLRIENPAAGTNVIDQSVTDTAYSFVPENPGTYTVVMRAFNDAGQSEKITRSLQVRGIGEEAWISGEALGTEQAAFAVGEPVYFNYRIFDPATDALFYSYATRGTSAELTVTGPDGSVLALGSFTDDDQDSIRLLCTQPGTYTAQAVINGSTYTTSFTADAVTYPVTYDANGGSGAPEAQEKVQGQPLTLRTQIPVREGWVFLGWAESPDASAPDYQPGGQYTADAPAVLYALWEEEVPLLASGWSGDTEWKLTEEGILIFSGEGAMRNYTYKSQMPWYGYFDQISSVVIEEGVTSIGSYAFYGMAIESIEIASTVTTIGDYAFKNAAALDGVVLPGGLTRLGESAFYGCTSLSAIEIPASLWTVQPYTFKNCTALAEVTFHEGNLQKISDGAFYNTALTELVLPDCLDILDVYSFKNCTELASITLGNGLTELREAVFYGTAIADIEIPEGVTKIGPYAFKNCILLETILLPETLTSLGEASFYGCTGLTSVDFPDRVAKIGNYAFRRCTALETVAFGSGLEDIGESSFYGCTGLTELSIPDSVTAIRDYAFKSCTGLTEVTLGEGLTTIGDSAFHSCTGLKTLLFPASVESIGAYCFSGSCNLWELTFEGDAPAIGTAAFRTISATAWYPGDNATWTADVMENYGGSITWKAN